MSGSKTGLVQPKRCAIPKFGTALKTQDEIRRASLQNERDFVSRWEFSNYLDRKAAFQNPVDLMDANNRKEQKHNDKFLEDISMEELACKIKNSMRRRKARKQKGPRERSDQEWKELIKNYQTKLQDTVSMVSFLMDENHRLAEILASNADETE